MLVVLWSGLKHCIHACQVTVLDFAPEHALSYNELIEVVKKNLLLGDWGDEDHIESLLSLRNSKWGQEMLKNVRWDDVIILGLMRQNFCLILI